MSGHWVLAIDFGTSFTSAAMVVDGRVEVLEVDGLRRLPSTVLWAHDELVVGTAAESQRVLNPRASERNPKRSLGLRRNLLLDGHAVPVEQAVAAVLGAVYQEALRRSGQVPPAEVRLTHPVRWSNDRLQALRVAAAVAGIPSVSLMAEPVAAAVHYGGGHVATGEYVAVYDLGGGTFDTTVLRRIDDGFELAGPPGGDDRLGGEDFDHRLMDFVLARLAVTEPDAATALRESDDLQWRRAASQLLVESRQAKEALSRQTAYTMLLPAPVSQEVRLTRPEFEALIRADIQRSIDEFSATIDAAGLEPSDISARYLTGGSSRIPLVSRLLHEAFDAVPDTFDDPKVAVALGAAQAPHIDDFQEPPTVPLAVAAAAVVGAGVAAVASADEDSAEVRDEPTVEMAAIEEEVPAAVADAEPDAGVDAVPDAPAALPPPPDPPVEVAAAASTEASEPETDLVDTAVDETAVGAPIAAETETAVDGVLPSPPPVPPPAGDDELLEPEPPEGAAGGPPRRKLLIGAGIAAVVVLLAGVVAVAMTRGGDESPVEEVELASVEASTTSSTTTIPETTTSTEAPPTTDTTEAPVDPEALQRLADAYARQQFLDALARSGNDGGGGGGGGGGADPPPPTESVEQPKIINPDTGERTKVVVSPKPQGQIAALDDYDSWVACWDSANQWYWEKLIYVLRNDSGPYDRIEWQYTGGDDGVYDGNLRWDEGQSVFYFQPFVYGVREWFRYRVYSSSTGASSGWATVTMDVTSWQYAEYCY